MNDKIIGSMEGSSVLNIAALIIIFAGMVYAKSIITPVLVALFISIICAQPITWLEKKRIPRWLALIIVIFGNDCTFFRIYFPDRRIIIILFKQPFKI